MNIIDTDTQLIFECGKNTSYISSLLIALYYNDSYISNTISDEPVDIMSIYLQELIYVKFVYNIRFKYFVDCATLNEIRNFMVFLGWNKHDDIVNMCKVDELYDFLTYVFNSKNITLKHKTTGDVTQIATIEGSVDSSTTTKNIISSWKTKTDIDHDLNELPLYLVLNIKRSSKHIEIDINEWVNGVVTDKKMWWEINSIICYSETKNIYYTVLRNKNKKWMMFNESTINSMYEINIADVDLARIIRLECVMIVYTIKNNHDI